MPNDRIPERGPSAFYDSGYPMSYIEFFGTILYLWSVWLIARRNLLTWPVGIASVLLYLGLFYQIRLYSDAIEQVYYLFASVYGWWYWSKPSEEQGDAVNVGYSSSRTMLVSLLITGVLSAVAGAAMSRMHIFMPVLFPEKASFPYLDAITTIMSFTAMFLMARKRIESWIYWIVVDVIGTGLYYVKEVRFVSLLYVILLVMAINGFVTWRHTASRVSSCGPPVNRGPS